MNRISCITLALLSLAGTDARADHLLFVSAKKLHDKLHGAEVENAVASAYIQGVFDTWTLTDSPIFCPPRNLKAAQLAPLVKDYLDAHPEQWDTSAPLSGPLVILKALVPTYACKKPN
jgi:hypothetical protein